MIPLRKDAEDDVGQLISEAKDQCTRLLEKIKPFHAAITQRLDANEEVRGSELEELYQSSMGADVSL